MITFSNVESDFIAFDEDSFTLRVNGIDSQDLPDGTYFVVSLTFDSDDESSRYMKLNVFAILNFKQRSSGITEGLDEEGEPEALIDINKPWVEYYLTNY